jgi:hypothetical protein
MVSVTIFTYMCLKPCDIYLTILLIKYLIKRASLMLRTWIIGGDRDWTWSIWNIGWETFSTVIKSETSLIDPIVTRKRIQQFSFYFSQIFMFKKKLYYHISQLNWTMSHDIMSHKFNIGWVAKRHSTASWAPPTPHHHKLNYVDDSPPHTTHSKLWVLPHRSKMNILNLPWANYIFTRSKNRYPIHR